jgi:hypothetical protein
LLAGLSYPDTALVAASVDLTRFVLNGVEIGDQRPVGDFHAVLGTPSRIVAAVPPAPPGHRNNQIHFYDEDGLYLIEHHYTFTIGEICFVLWRDEAVHKPTGELAGALNVGGVAVHAGIAERELLASAIPFEARVAGLWSWKGAPLYVGFQSRGRKDRSGRRASKRYAIAVSICFEGDPFETRHRPR